MFLYMINLYCLDNLRVLLELWRLLLLSKLVSSCAAMNESNHPLEPVVVQPELDRSCQLRREPYRETFATIHPAEKGCSFNSEPRLVALWRKAYIKTPCWAFRCGALHLVLHVHFQEATLDFAWKMRAGFLLSVWHFWESTEVHACQANTGKAIGVAAWRLWSRLAFIRSENSKLQLLNMHFLWVPSTCTTLLCWC